MRRRVGRWVIGVGIVQTAFALATFPGPLLDMLRDGLVDTADATPQRSLAFWFLFSGLLLVVVGMLVDAGEGHATSRLPRRVGYWLLGLTVLGCVAMPVSGFWLLLPAAFGTIGMERRHARRVTWSGEAERLTLRR